MAAVAPSVHVRPECTPEPGFLKVEVSRLCCKYVVKVVADKGAA
jgi:hypothetical protein